MIKYITHEIFTSINFGVNKQTNNQTNMVGEVGQGKETRAGGMN